MVLDGWLVTTLADGRLSLRRITRLRGEEWRVGTEGLEVFRDGPTQRMEWAFFDAALRMTRSYGGTSLHQLFVVSGKDRFLLYSNPYDEVTRRIALELAERTGWPFETEVW